MAKLKIDIRKLPKAVRIIIAVMPPILFILLFGYFASYPKYKMINAFKQDIAKQEGEIAKSQGMAEKLDTLKQETEKLKERLKELSKQLPAEKEISAFLRQVSDLGSKSDLTITSWNRSPKRTHPSGIVYEEPVAVVLTGGYHNLGRFFSSLTNLDRIVNISDISLSFSKVEEGRAMLGVSFSAVTFTAVAEGGIAEVGGAKK